MKKNRIVEYVKVCQEGCEDQIIEFYGINSNDILTLLNDHAKTEDWDLTYYIRVTNAIEKINKLFF